MCTNSRSASEGESVQTRQSPLQKKRDLEHDVEQSHLPHIHTYMSVTRCPWSKTDELGLFRISSLQPYSRVPAVWISFTHTCSSTDLYSSSLNTLLLNYFWTSFLFHWWKFSGCRYTAGIASIIIKPFVYLLRRSYRSTVRKPCALQNSPRAEFICLRASSEWYPLFWRFGCGATVLHERDW